VLHGFRARDAAVDEPQPQLDPSDWPDDPGAPKWYCRLCAVERYNDEVDLQYLGAQRFALCKTCWNACVSTAAIRREPEDPGPSSIARGLGDALAYPLRDGAWLTLLIGGGIFSAYYLMVSFSLFRHILLLPLLLYLGAYLWRVLGDASVARRALSDWPDLGDFAEDVFKPAARLAWIAGWCLMPAVLWYFEHSVGVLDGAGDGRLEAFLTNVFQLKPQPAWSVFGGDVGALCVWAALIAAGLAYLSVAMSAVAVGQSWLSARPTVVIPGACRGGFDTIVLAVAWCAFGALVIAVHGLTLRWMLAGPLLTAWTFFYGALVVMHLSGRWAWVNRQRLRWVLDDGGGEVLARDEGAGSMEGD